MALEIRAFQERNLSEIFREVAEKNAEKIGIRILKDGERQEATLTYRELYLRSLALAAKLSQAHAPGDRVLLLFDTSLEFIISFWACVLGGFVAVPVYPPLNERAQKRLWKLIDDCGCNTLLTTSFFKEKIGLGRWFISSLRRLDWMIVDAEAPIEKNTFVPPNNSSEQTVLLQYTSGSTGFPKGVMISHQNIVQNFLMILKVIDPRNEGSWKSDSLVSWLPLYHDMGLIGGVIFPVLAGSTATLMSPLLFLQKPVRWLRALDRYRATVSAAPDFAYRLCAQKVKDEELQGLNLSQWTVAINGAEPVRSSTLELFYQKFKSTGFRKESFFPTYGLAEATIFVTGAERGSAPNEITLCQKSLQENHQAREVKKDQGGAQTFVSCGRSGWELSLKLFDHEKIRECSEREVGEILISGKNVTRGYWKQETSSFIQISGIPYFRTGDLGFLHQGELYVTGRSKDLMIVRGKNIYPQDLELAFETMPEVRPGGVVAFSHAAEDSEESILILVEVRDEEKFRSVENQKSLIQKLNQVLSAEFGLAAQIFLVPKGSLLKTSSGKIQRSECKNMFLNQKLKPIRGFHAQLSGIL